MYSRSKFVLKTLDIIKNGIKKEDPRWGIGIRIDYRILPDILVDLNINIKLPDSFLVSNDFTSPPQFIIRYDNKKYYLHIECYPNNNIKEKNTPLTGTQVVSIIKMIESEYISFYDINNKDYYPD